jgi:hypothetical protein
MKTRDIGIYDHGGNLQAVIKNAKSYKDAAEQFRKKFTGHPLVYSQYGFIMKNIEK